MGRVRGLRTVGLPFNNRNVILKHVLANGRVQRSNAFLISPSEAIICQSNNPCQSNKIRIEIEVK